MLPCIFKYFTSLDCPGCGLQRSILLLFQGNFKASFLQYPPTIFFLSTLLVLILHLYRKTNVSFSVLRVSIFLMITAVLTNYILKSVSLLFN
ncbi:MAG: DUF2752 domain-containing protein [Bacteroidota bacterium]